MAAMTVQAIRDYVREYLETDEEEMSDNLINVWRDEGVARIQRTFEPWRFYEHTWFMTTADAARRLDALDGTDAVPAQRIRSVLEVEPWTLLTPMPHETAIRTFTDDRGRPCAWSVEREELFLWPPPSDTYTYAVRGYREPVPAVDATDLIDLPEEFHPLVCEWTLARAYEQQDDEIMSTQKFGRFEILLDGFRRRHLRNIPAGVGAIGEHATGQQDVPARLRYDWEF